ncbi:MAG: Asp-tRNA(Asn)/Glu-tRNA(Gln) amidotransferase subunit GatA [Armatimonadetes bacterium]|nr:Asp-tRNA(Asn)/Glu-tRNA(Gln) amidotransferase subunit GatA [Armatimonadota bacterium]
MSELYERTACELVDLVKNGETSWGEVADAQFRRIAAVEDRVKAFMTVTEDAGRAAAQRADAGGDPFNPLSGVPGALKDNMCTRGILTTCSSKILHNWVPPYDATVTEKLMATGMVLVGKTNMDEFAMGSSTENSGFFTTRNPWDLNRVPGGSSGGSAAAVAAGEAVYALGSDTGGSIRQPAAFCGIVGMKPTYGRVSRFGLVAFGSSLDQIGPLTKDMRDCALVMNAIVGHDPNDATSVPMEAPDFTESLREDVRGLRIGRPKEYFPEEGIEPAVRDAVETALASLADLGAEIVEVSLPHTEYALPVYYLIAPSEASSNLARYDGVRHGYRTPGDVDMIEMYLKTRDEGFGAEVKRRIMLGTYALSAGYYDAYYRKAQQVRTLIARDFERAWEKVDLLLTPSTPTVAFPIGERADDPLAMYLNDIFTIPTNLAGLPALSLPCGFSPEGLPVGLQLIGKAFDEETLFRVGYTYERSTEWHRARPTLPP